MTDLTGIRDNDALEPIGFLVSHRMNWFGSGVAKFNHILAGQLGVPIHALFDEGTPSEGVALLSFKVGEFSDVERQNLADILSTVNWRTRVFLHDWAGTEVEERMTRAADVVYCGNHEVHARVQHLNANVVMGWSPGLILDARTFHPTALSVFSFGMAHKVRAEELARLRELLERSGHSYAVYVSSANHESASLRDAQSVYEAVNRLFPAGLFFLGNLSDVAVYNYLQQTTFFAAFFPKGVRANNGTVAAAMEHGAVVITNLDEFSPPEFVHMHNIIDINQCEELPLEAMTLKSIAVEAMRTARRRRFPQLAAILRGGGEVSVGATEAYSDAR
jgi:hypothetical protein